jgi:hypothetical protein
LVQNGWNDILVLEQKKWGYFALFDNLVDFFLNEVVYFWDVMLFSLVGRHQSFRGIYCIHHQGRKMSQVWKDNTWHREGITRMRALSRN